MQSVVTAASGTSEPPMDGTSVQEDCGIVVFSHLRWNFVWQRPQQFLSRFASRHKVLFVEEADFSLPDTDSPKMLIENAATKITVVTIKFPGSWRGHERVPEQMRNFAQEAMKQVNRAGEFDRPLLWYYSPMEAAWSLGYFPSRGVVYDCMDELSLFHGAPRELVEEEQKLLNSADVVFTGGYELWTSKTKQHDNVHFFGCGVEYDHFALAQNPKTEIPGDVRDLRKPIIGWFGVVDERVDYDLIRKMSELRPDWSFVLVGPVVKVDPNSLPQAPNIHWLGQRGYQELPGYCKAFDVCMMCFALNDATKFINPTKALEYLATGKPVVSTPVADVVRQYSEVLAIAHTPQEFVRACEDALAGKNPERIQKGIVKARNASWESTVEQMRSLIGEALAKQDDSQPSTGAGGV